MAIPVLLIAFNRPNLVERQVELLRTMEISKLYVAVDGPRDGNEDDRNNCAEVRRVIEQAEFDFPVQTSFQISNLGCGRAVSQAISWFFANEEAGAILEDDCLADASFFKFAETLLTRYTDDETVFMISGNNFNSEFSIPPNSYGFTKYPHIWGWASWRRAWRNYDFNIESWPASKKSGLLRRKFPGRHKSRRYWERCFDGVHKKTIDTWDYQWVLTIWQSNGLIVIPPFNLVTNGGFGSDATHPAPEPEWWSKRLSGTVQFPLFDPQNRDLNERHESFEESIVFATNRPLRCRLKSRF